MEELVLELGDLLHLLVLLDLHLQQLYGETLLSSSCCCLAPALPAPAPLLHAPPCLPLTLVRFLRGEDIEDRAGDVLLVEVDFVGLAALLAETSLSRNGLDRLGFMIGSGIMIDVKIGISVRGKVGGIFELSTEVDEFEFKFVENIEFLLIKQFLLVADPDIIQIDIVEVV